MSSTFLRTGSAAALAASLLGCVLTSDGSTGDPHTEPVADVRGDGSLISEELGEATWFEPGNIESAGCKFPIDRTARITGQMIVSIDEFDETDDGAAGNIYVQDVDDSGVAPGPYSGITVFAPGFTPPDLRLFNGDIVDTFGALTEFTGPPPTGFGECKTLPEIGGTMTFRRDGFAPQPLTIVLATGGSRWDEVKGYEKARQWIGMLVRIEGVILTEDGVEDDNGRMSIAMDMGGGLSGGDVIGVSNELFDLQESGLALETGTTYTAVTGVMTYFYGFRLAPRSVEDFEL